MISFPPLSTMSLSPTKRKADEAIAINSTMPFKTKNKITRTFGRTTIMVYPDVTSDMDDIERALAYNIDKSALINARAIPYSQKLSIFREILGCSNLVEVELRTYTNAAFAFLKQGTNLTLITYHNKQGAIVNNALDNTGTLKPIQNGATADCRPDNIHYACISTTISFVNIDTTAKDVPFTFFIRLPTGNRNLTNTTGVVRTMHTFTGPSNWLNLADGQYQTLVYDHNKSIEEPFTLLPPNFASPDAVVELEDTINRLEERVNKAVWNPILQKMFRQVCPNFLNDPYKIQSQVKQIMIIDGVEMISPVREYHTQTQTVISTFDKADATWPTNPFRIFTDGLAPNIKEQMEQNNFRLHTQACSLAPHDQMNFIQRAYEAATLAEKQLKQQKSMVGRWG